MSQKEAPKTKQEILAESLEARRQEVMYYQINIDNYTAALVEIASLAPSEKADLSSFVEQLQNLLTTEKLEQKKAKIMLTVLEKQVA